MKERRVKERFERAGAKRGAGACRGGISRDTIRRHYGLLSFFPADADGRDDASTFLVGLGKKQNTQGPTKWSGNIARPNPCPGRPGRPSCGGVVGGAFNDGLSEIDWLPEGRGPCRTLSMTMPDAADGRVSLGPRA
jgi:hypothetical protein